MCCLQRNCFSLWSLFFKALMISCRMFSVCLGKLDAHELGCWSVLCGGFKWCLLWVEDGGLGGQSYGGGGESTGTVSVVCEK